MSKFSNETIHGLMERASRTELEPQLRDYAKVLGLSIVDSKDEANDAAITRDDLVARLRSEQEQVYAMITGEDFDGEKLDVPQVSIKEALNTSDASIVFPRVISQILQEPQEPNLFLMNQIADKIVLPANAPSLIEFPTVSAIQAQDMSEGQEYAVQNPSFGEFMTSLRIRKIGTAVALTEEIIKHSLWNLVALHLRLMAAAIDRKIEKNLYTAMVNTAQNVFDNESATAEYRTTGVTSTQAVNGSFSYFDLVKMMSVALGNKKTGSHLLTHPLAWPILAQDPLMMANFFHGGQMGQGAWTRAPQFDQQAAMPFGIQYVPYYNIAFTENYTLTGALSGQGASLVTDMYLLDKSDSLFMATAGEKEMDQMDNWFKDALMMKARQYVAVSAKDGGKGMFSAKKIRVVRNYEALFTVRTIAS